MRQGRIWGPRVSDSIQLLSRNLLVPTRQRGCQAHRILGCVAQRHGAVWEDMGPHVSDSILLSSRNLLVRTRWPGCPASQISWCVAQRCGAVGAWRGDNIGMACATSGAIPAPFKRWQQEGHLPTPNLHTPYAILVLQEHSPGTSFRRSHIRRQQRLLGCNQGDVCIPILCSRHRYK